MIPTFRQNYFNKFIWHSISWYAMNQFVKRLKSYKFWKTSRTNEPKTVKAPKITRISNYFTSKLHYKKIDIEFDTGRIMLSKP